MVYVAHIGPNGTSTYSTLQTTKADCIIGNHNCLLSHVHVRPFSTTSRDNYQSLSENSRPVSWTQECSNFARVPSVLRVRIPPVACAQSYELSMSCHRLTGLCGMFFSLQYLSLSDATVLTFLIPTFTGFSGALFLKEPFLLRELFAGCTYDTSSLSFSLTRGQYSALLESY